MLLSLIHSKGNPMTKVLLSDELFATAAEVPLLYTIAQKALSVGVKTSVCIAA